MTAYIEHKRLQNPDGTQEVTIEEGDHGLCRFVTWKLYDPAPDIPEIGGPTWTLDEFSGHFASLAEAEEAAKAQIGWL